MLRLRFRVVQLSLGVSAPAAATTMLCDCLGGRSSERLASGPFPFICDVDRGFGLCGLSLALWAAKVVVSDLFHDLSGRPSCVSDRCLERSRVCDPAPSLPVTVCTGLEAAGKMAG